MDDRADAVETNAPRERSPDGEPDARGTLVIVTVFLMALAGLWIIMYITLLGR